MKRTRSIRIGIAALAGAAFFAGPAISEQLTVTGALQKIVVAHASGLISLEYEPDQQPLYANVLHFGLSREISNARLECVHSQIAVDESRANFLSDEVKRTIDSLKRPNGQYSDYRIISGLLRKYAGRVTASSSPGFSVEISDPWEGGKTNRIAASQNDFFAGDCQGLIRAMLPATTANGDAIISGDICRSLAELKTCYATLDDLHAQHATARRNELRVRAAGQLDAQQGVGLKDK